MIRIRLIDHIVLRTQNVDNMVHFYSKVLGCKVERSLPPETGLTQLRAGLSLIDIVAVNSELGRTGGDAPARSGNNLDHFCLQIEYINEGELRSWLDAQGFGDADLQTRYGAEGFGPSVYISDPDGNTVELRCERNETRGSP